MNHGEIFTVTHVWERELKQIISSPGKWSNRSVTESLSKAASSGI